MAWGARPGLKRHGGKHKGVYCLGLNGLGSPSGIETGYQGCLTIQKRSAKWPGEPVRDSSDNRLKEYGNACDARFSCLCLRRSIIVLETGLYQATSLTFSILA